MARALSFGEVLETVGRLSLEDQETLVHIIRRRVVEQRRAELTKDIREAREALEAGDVRPVTSDELMGEILS